jgi:small-conductance mechanosensitive channel
VVFNTLKKDTLLENVKKIAIDVEDILVKIPEDYFISPDEFKNIYDYTDYNNVRLSIKRLPLKGK